MKRKISFALLIIIGLYLLLLIPTERQIELKSAAKKQFVWNRDSLWLTLENKFIDAKKYGCEKLEDSIHRNISQIENILERIQLQSPHPEDNIFNELENKMFLMATLVGGCEKHRTDFITLYTRIRKVIKDKSVCWNPNNMSARKTLYKIIYGGRAAVEELLLQINKKEIPPLILCDDDKPKTPGTNILGAEIHSGDILVSRGGAPTSALIARGSDYPGNFSHVALVYVEENTKLPYIIESHIERGVVISSIYDYLNDKKLRVMVLRLRNDLQQIQNDPELPHKAARSIYERVKLNHIPYDFAMDCTDTSKLFCSEVASFAYKNYGIKLWKIVSSVSSLGAAQWLAGFGVTNFEFQEPSDLEYDSQLNVVAEWRNPETLYQDHLDNAVVEALLDWANEGNPLTYDWYMLPFARITKMYSWLLNQFGKEGPVPEGMSPEAGLRHKKFNAIHARIRSEVEKKAQLFLVNKKYRAPYWKMVSFAKESLSQIN